VRVVYTGGAGETIWYFSTKDYLPRRRVRPFTSPQGAGTFEYVLTDLEVSPKVEDSLFTLNLPEGYERIDDFAP
jgi:outer membrane lipoprotein-sorting protein